MGYEISFTPPKEVAEKQLKKRVNNAYREETLEDIESKLQEAKDELIVSCMADSSEEMTMRVRKGIEFKMLYLYKLQEDFERESAYERFEKDGYFYYCGWEMARSSDFVKETILANNIKTLLILTQIVKTPDYFDEEEKFNTKLERIEECIDGFLDCAADIIIHEICDEFSEYKEKDDDDYDWPDNGNPMYTGDTIDNEVKSEDEPKE